jgi:hypothetical protein
MGMKTDLSEITVVLIPDLDSAGISSEDFDRIYSNFEKHVNEGHFTVTGYCNKTFGCPTHIVTNIECREAGTYQARIAFLESHPDARDMAKDLLAASLRGDVRWLFAITHEPLEIRSIEALTENGKLL